ncbi:prepilin-type N-terminal cleavage/methylation domain-containing protein [Candidatus Saccharibacteria bacterium]|nr:prepilin-type N-terminal cleavage/methylation domain-containing protein [Candidatus Saccharibacteria bacterium]
MSLLRWATNRHVVSESGYSLLELLIVIVITGLIALPLSTFLIKGLSSYNFIQAQSDTALELQTLSDRVTKVVRGATSLDTASPDTLIVYAYFSPQDTVIDKVRYFVNGTNLNIGVTPPTGTAPSYTYLPANEKFYTTRIDLAMGTASLFTYYDDADNLLTGSFLPSQVKEVGLYVAANPNAKQVPVPISISTKVTLRNLKTNL